MSDAGRVLNGSSREAWERNDLAEPPRRARGVIRSFGSIFTEILKETK